MIPSYSDCFTSNIGPKGIKVNIRGRRIGLELPAKTLHLGPDSQAIKP